MGLHSRDYSVSSLLLRYFDVLHPSRPRIEAVLSIAEGGPLGAGGHYEGAASHLNTELVE